MEYKASLDKFAKIITVGTIIFLLIIAYVYLTASHISHNGSSSPIFNSLGILILILIIVPSYFLSPKMYILDGNELIIARRLGSKKIGLNNIVEVRNFDESDIKSAKRLLASSGLFGYFGKFYVKPIGNVTFYATQRRNGILIITEDGKYILITPDDISLAETLRGRMKQ